MVKIKIFTPPIIAKTLAVTGFATSILLGAAPAHAINFNFQFQDTFGGTNGFVTGTLSGLVEGNNTGLGITATVIQSLVNYGWEHLGIKVLLTEYTLVAILGLPIITTLQQHSRPLQHLFPLSLTRPWE